MCLYTTKCVADTRTTSLLPLPTSKNYVQILSVYAKKFLTLNQTFYIFSMFASNTDYCSKKKLQNKLSEIVTLCFCFSFKNLWVLLRVSVFEHLDIYRTIRLLMVLALLMYGHWVCLLKTMWCFHYRTFSQQIMPRWRLRFDSVDVANDDPLVVSILFRFFFYCLRCNIVTIRTFAPNLQLYKSWAII